MSQPTTVDWPPTQDSRRIQRNNKQWNEAKRSMAHVNKRTITTKGAENKQLFIEYLKDQYVPVTPKISKVKMDNKNLTII